MCFHGAWRYHFWARSEPSACLVFSELLVPAGMEIKTPLLMSVMIHTLQGLSLGFRKPSHGNGLKCCVQGQSASLGSLLGQSAEDTSRNRDILHKSDIAQLGQGCSQPPSPELRSALASADCPAISTDFLLGLRPSALRVSHTSFRSKSAALAAFLVTSHWSHSEDLNPSPSLVSRVFSIRKIRGRVQSPK